MWGVESFLLVSLSLLVVGAYWSVFYQRLIA